MQPRWSPSIPQAMQPHGASSKKVQPPEKAKQTPRELETVEAGHDRPERRQDQALDRLLDRRGH